MARVKKVRKGTKNCANSGTQSAQNEMDRNAQFLREKVRRDKVYRLIYRYELRIVNFSDQFSGKNQISTMSENSASPYWARITSQKGDGRI